MANRFDVVALWVNDKRAVIVCVVVRTKTWGSVAFSTCCDGRCIESIHLCSIRGMPCQMASRRSRWAAVRRRTINEPNIRLFAVRLGGVRVRKPKNIGTKVAFGAYAVAQWRQRNAVERFGTGNVFDAKCHVVKHVKHSFLDSKITTIVLHIKWYTC